MSFAMSSLQDALGVSSTRVPVGVTTFVSYVVPLLLCYVLFAMLAVTPQTRYIQVALWPVLALLAFRAAVSLDMSYGNPKQDYLDGDSLHGFILQRAMISICFNTLSWISAKKPLVRHLRPANSFPSTIMDALDLTSNFRGIGWDWSRGLYVPHETRPTNRILFAFYALISAVANTLMCGILYRAIHTFTAGTGSSPSIFDGTLPLFARYLRASIISALAGLTTYIGMQMKYDLLTVLGILLFGQDPAQWPPAFDSPWCATSLSDLWGHRWHQFYRQTFLLGAYPLSVVFGRVGWIIGAFLTSALFHHLMMLTFNSQSNVWSMLIGFGAMGLGILVERTFYKSTGRKVGGIAGWVWTMAWLLVWGNVIVDGFLGGGMFAQSVTMDSQSPLVVLIDNLVIDFDAWLHTI